MTAPAPFETSEKEATVSTQIQHSGLGEIVGFAVSIGAVYLAEHAFPAQTNAFVERLAQKIGEWRHTSPEIQRELAKTITDVTIMNVGGITNMAAQFAIRRQTTKPEDRKPLPYELGRLLSGRLVGTVGAVGALALAETHAPLLMDKGQAQLGRWLGGNAASNRFAGLMISNLVQSVGGVAGNVPAQLLYDRLVGQHLSQAR